MKPFDAELGSIWVYNIERAQKHEIEAAKDEESIFLVLDGIMTKDDTVFPSKKYRRAMSLLSGQPENFSVDSRLNNYSERLL